MRYLYQLQLLERRSLLAGAPFAHLTNSGTLDVLGDGAANVITVTDSGDNIIAALDGQSLLFSTLAVKRVGVSGGAGADQISLDVLVPSVVLGGDGNDTITGGAGDDQLDGGSGDDVLDGGAGDDFIGGGDGFDTADYFSRDHAFQFRTSGLFSTGDPPDEITERDAPGFAFSGYEFEPPERDIIGYFVEVIAGTSHDDSFELSSTEDRQVDGRGGDDYFDSQEFYAAVTIFGGAGNDHYRAGPFLEDDSFHGGSGADIMSLDRNRLSPEPMPRVYEGGSGRDRVNLVGAPDDLLFDLRAYPSIEEVTAALGTSAPMTIVGNDLPNTITASNPPFPTIGAIIYGMGGNDTLNGTAGPDALFGGDGDDLLVGGLGNDTLRGEGGNDILGGSAGADKLFGHSGNDNLNGGSGNDRLDGGTGVDTFAGASGNDILLGRDNNAEILNGGSGIDSAQADDDLDALFGVEQSLP